jgi:uncharacterized protein YxeA
MAFLNIKIVWSQKEVLVKFLDIPLTSVIQQQIHAEHYLSLISGTQEDETQLVQEDKDEEKMQIIKRSGQDDGNELETQFSSKSGRKKRKKFQIKLKSHVKIFLPFLFVSLVSCLYILGSHVISK